MNPFQFLKRRLGGIVVLGVVGYSLVYALAFIQLYSMEHPYKVASQWIFENVPAGSRIASPHWDDKVPVGIPGKDSAIYKLHGRDFELPVYERDTPQMIESIVKKTVAADYLTFATPRAADSIPRIPDEYPNMAAFLRLLWGEKLGFTLVHTTKNRPSFMGITFNDDLADESFSVYDHPKVVVFKNDQRLSEEEILERIRNVKRYEPLPTMDEMLLMDKGGWTPQKRLWDPAWSSFIELLITVLALGAAVWILIGRLFRFLPDGGIGLSALIGVVIAFALAWAGSAVHVLPLTRAGGRFVVLSLGVMASLKFMVRESTRQRVIHTLGRHGVAALVSIAIGAAVVVVMRSSDSALVGLGEYVDAVYLSYLARNQESLPWDLWTPGSRLSPAFLDRFVLGWLLKTTGTPLEIAVNASFVVMGGLCGGLLYTLFSAVLGRSRPAVIGVLIASIPVVYLLHVVRDVTAAPLASKSNEREYRDLGEFVKWVEHKVVATPFLVESCDPGQQLSVAAYVGLPRFTDVVVHSDEAVEPNLCGIKDPEKAYNQMMKLGLELFATAPDDISGTPDPESRYGKFIGRPDLFAKVFEDHRVALFVPAFSKYYPRKVVS